MLLEQLKVSGISHCWDNSHRSIRYVEEGCLDRSSLLSDLPYPYLVDRTEDSSPRYTQVADLPFEPQVYGYKRTNSIALKEVSLQYH